MFRVRTPAMSLFALATLAACADAPADPSAVLVPQSVSAAQAEDPVAPGEVLVKFKANVDGGKVLRAYGLSRGKLGYKGKFETLSTSRGSERAVAARLAADPNVEWAEPNYIRQPHAIDGRLWNFYNPGGLNMKFNDPTQTNFGTFIPASYASKTDADVDAIEGIGAGGAPVVVSGIDTGVDFNHPEFAGRLIAGCDWYSQAAAGNSSGTCSDFTPYDTPDEGHGTHTAGTMAGANVGVAGVSGAASNVKILVQRVCGPVGCYTSSIVNAIYAAADYPGMVAMNLSLGGGTLSTGEKNAINYAVNTKNVLVVASAGNSARSQVDCPACDANAISVSATDWKDALAGYSSYGKGLDITAPGGYCYSNTTAEGCIFSAVVAGYQGGQIHTGPAAGGAYGYMNGTSMSSPAVAGVAAVVASKTGLRGAALRNRLQSTADDIGTAGYDTKFGYGRVNLYRALTGGTLPSPQ